MKMNFTAMAVAAGAALLSTSSFAQQQLPPHPAPTHQAAPAPKAPGLGAHPLAGRAYLAAVHAHAKTSCEHLGHHFVGSAVFKQFYQECMNTHVATLSHIPPRAVAAAAAAAGAAKK
jgi:hypothetical protein